MQGGHYYHFWTDGVGTVSMTLGDAGHYTVVCDECGNVVAGTGWATGGRGTVKWAGDFAPSGSGSLSVYGWTTNPLVEYCIMYGYGSYRPAFSDHRDVVASVQYAQALEKQAASETVPGPLADRLVRRAAQLRALADRHELDRFHPQEPTS
ncbi:hypothetical protein GCM10010129_57890 [Streptomyces fumigatiscleroticus]|nr:hypothetical protein GCM10010129_57890 [Streptomyces fumigatiscleroticus]